MSRRRSKRALDGMCQTGKRRYSSELAAEATLQRIWETATPRRPYMERRAYRCNECGSWHLTHQPKKS